MMPFPSEELASSSIPATTSSTPMAPSPTRSTVWIAPKFGVIPVGKGPEGMAYDRDRHRVYVACSRSNDVAVVDLAAGVTRARVETGAGPIPVVYDAGRDLIFVAGARSDTITVIDVEVLDVVAQIAVGGYLAGLVLHPARPKL